MCAPRDKNRSSQRRHARIFGRVPASRQFFRNPGVNPRRLALARTAAMSVPTLRENPRSAARSPARVRSMMRWSRLPSRNGFFWRSVPRSMLLLRLMTNGKTRGRRRVPPSALRVPAAPGRSKGIPLSSEEDHTRFDPQLQGYSASPWNYPPDGAGQPRARAHSACAPSSAPSSSIEGKRS